MTAQVLLWHSSNRTTVPETLRGVIQRAAPSIALLPCRCVGGWSLGVWRHRSNTVELWILQSDEKAPEGLIPFLTQVYGPGVEVAVQHSPATVPLQDRGLRILWDAERLMHQMTTAVPFPPQPPRREPDMDVLRNRLCWLVQGMIETLHHPDKDSTEMLYAIFRLFHRPLLSPSNLDLLAHAQQRARLANREIVKPYQTFDSIMHWAQLKVLAENAVRLLQDGW